MRLLRSQHFRKGNFEKSIEIYELLLSRGQEVRPASCFLHPFQSLNCGFTCEDRATT